MKSLMREREAVADIFVQRAVLPSDRHSFSFSVHSNKLNTLRSVGSLRKH